MFLTLLVVTFVISLAVSFLVVCLFRSAIGNILERILSDPISVAWVRYLLFAIYVVGISSGVRIWDLEKYINPRVLRSETQAPLVLNVDRWILEVYRTVIESLQGIAWLLLVFFVFALIGFIIVRVGEMKYARRETAERE